MFPTDTDVDGASGREVRVALSKPVALERETFMLLTAIITGPSFTPPCLPISLMPPHSNALAAALPPHANALAAAPGPRSRSRPRPCPYPLRLLTAYPAVSSTAHIAQSRHTTVSAACSRVAQQPSAHTTLHTCTSSYTRASSATPTALLPHLLLYSRDF